MLLSVYFSVLHAVFLTEMTQYKPAT